MLSENLKSFRRSKGLTQEELADRLHVVRQTVSKWEKGSSVPDADLLIRIAEILEVSVSELLGPQVKESARETTAADIAVQLSRINEQLAIKNRRSRRIWKTIVIVVISVIALNILLLIFSYPASHTLTGTTTKMQQAEEQIVDTNG